MLQEIGGMTERYRVRETSLRRHGQHRQPIPIFELQHIATKSSHLSLADFHNLHSTRKLTTVSMNAVNLVRHWPVFFMEDFQVQV